MEIPIDLLLAAVYTQECEFNEKVTIETPVSSELLCVHASFSKIHPERFRHERANNNRQDTFWFELKKKPCPKLLANLGHNNRNVAPELKTCAIKWEYKLHSAELIGNRPMANMYRWKDAAEIWLQPKQKDKNSICPAMMMQRENMVSY